MKYDYQRAIVLSPDDGEPILLDRPVVFLRVHGPRGSERYAALIDSGADHCLLPHSVAAELGIDEQPCLGPASEGVGGKLNAQTFADVELELDDFIKWTARVFFVEDYSPEPQILLGFIGFLEFFTVVLDGAECILDLTRNEYLSQFGKSDQ